MWFPPIIIPFLKKGASLNTTTSITSFWVKLTLSMAHIGGDGTTYTRKQRQSLTNLIRSIDDDEWSSVTSSGAEKSNVVGFKPVFFNSESRPNAGNDGYDVLTGWRWWKSWKLSCLCGPTKKISVVFGCESAVHLYRSKFCWEHIRSYQLVGFLDYDCSHNLVIHKSTIQKIIKMFSRNAVIAAAFLASAEAFAPAMNKARSLTRPP